MPFGEAPQSKFFTPVPGRYAVRLLGIHDGKLQTYDDGKSSIPAVWTLAVYDQNGQPVLDSGNALQVPAITEPLSGMSVRFGNDGQPAKGRVWLKSFADGLGLPFLPDDPTLEQTQALVAQCIGGWAWWTWGPNPKKGSKTLVIVREVEAFRPQPTPRDYPLPKIVTAAASTAAVPGFGLAGATPPQQEAAAAPAAPTFQPPVQAAAAPPAPVFPGAAAAAPAAEGTPAIPTFTFPAS